MDIQTLQTHYQAHRQNYSEPFRLRIHRSLSWLDKAACTADEDLDNRFISIFKVKTTSFSWLALAFKISL